MDATYEVLTLGYDLHWYAGAAAGRPLGPAEDLARILNDYTARGWAVVAACGDDKFRQVMLRRAGSA